MREEDGEHEENDEDVKNGILKDGKMGRMGRMRRMRRMRRMGRMRRLHFK